MTRIDIVLDEYQDTTLKAATRRKRGQGVRQRVAPENRLPRNWSEFLRDGHNKEELFRLLSENITTSASNEKHVVSSHGKHVLSNVPLDNITRLAPCSQEEADTRMFLHVVDAIQSGFRKAIVRTVDTDVLVLAVALLNKLQALTGESIYLWVAFGTKVNLRYLAAHEIARSFVNGAALALPAFHAFTGVTPCRASMVKEKKKALDTWKCFPEGGSCSYHKVNLHCTALCKCQYECENR